MGPNRVLLSGGQLRLLAECRTSLYVVQRDRPGPALEALERLARRICEANDAYVAYMRGVGDHQRVAAGEWLKDWLSRDASVVVDELATRIRSASPSEQLQMERAIRAAEGFLDAATPHPCENMEEWDSLWGWAKEALLSLRYSFRQPPRCELAESEDVSEAETCYPGVPSPWTGTDSEEGRVWKFAAHSGFWQRPVLPMAA